MQTILSSDKDFVEILGLADEIINAPDYRNVADKEDPEGAKERARNAANETLRDNDQIAPNPFPLTLKEFPKPTEQSSRESLYFNPIIRADLQTPEGATTRADAILRKQLRESKNPVNGLNLVRQIKQPIGCFIVNSLCFVIQRISTVLL